MSTPKTYTDGTGLYIVTTRQEGELVYGLLVNVPDKSVSPETPVASITGWLPYSDFKPLEGELPAEAKTLLDSAKPGK